MKSPFRNLVFKGKGVKGIGHIGVLKYLDLDKINILKNIKRFGGTSAGAIITLGLGYNVNDLEEIVKKSV